MDDADATVENMLVQQDLSSDSPHDCRVSSQFSRAASASLEKLHSCSSSFQLSIAQQESASSLSFCLFPKIELSLST